MTEQKKSTKKKSRFWLGLLIYAWILIAACGALLYVFHDYMDAYEASRSQVYVNGYQEKLKVTLPAAAAEALSGLDPEIQSPEVNQAWAAELLSDARLVKDYSLSTEERQVYTIKAADGQELGSVTFAVTQSGKYDLPVWGTESEQFDFSAYYRSTGIVVPSDYSVYLGNRLLGSENIVERDIPYETLEECYLHYSGLPTMVRYEGGPFVVEPALRVCDPKGVELGPEELNEARFLDRCDPETREQVDAFIEEFIPAYVFFSADVNHSAMAYYGRLSALAVPHSQLQTRMQQAIQSFGWSNTKSLEILEIRINNVTDLGGGRYLVDVSYDSQITALQGPAMLEDHARIVLLDYEGRLLADAVYHY